MILVLAIFSPFSLAQYCDIEMLSYRSAKLNKSGHEFHLSQGYRSHVSMDIYSSCYLPAYPIVEIRSVTDGEVLGHSEIDSFGQIPNTTNRYELFLKADQLDFDTMEIFLYSGNKDRAEKVGVSILSEKALVDIYKTSVISDFHIIEIILEQALYGIRSRAFCGGQVANDVQLLNFEEAKSRILIPHISSCEDISIWVQGSAKPQGSKVSIYQNINIINK